MILLFSVELPQHFESFREADFMLKTGVSCHFLLQEIFPTQGLNPGLPHCRQMLYRLSHQESSRCCALLLHILLLGNMSFLAIGQCFHGPRPQATNYQ